jgi:hypothetical protein
VAQEAEALAEGEALGAAALAAVARLAEADGAGGGDGGAFRVALVAHRQAAGRAGGPIGGGVSGARPGLEQEPGDGQQAGAHLALGAVGVGQAVGELVDELLQGGQ